MAEGDGADAARAATDVLALGPATTLAAAAPEAHWRSLLLVAGAGGGSTDTNTRADPGAMAALLRLAADRDVAVTVLGPSARWSAGLDPARLTTLRRDAPTWWSLVAGYARSQSAVSRRHVLVLHDALAAALIAYPGLAATSTRRRVAATPDGLRDVAADATRGTTTDGPPPSGGADAVVTWVDHLLPETCDVVLDALLATEDAVAAGPRAGP